MADESGRQEVPLDLFIVSTFSFQIGFDELFLWAFIAALLDHSAQVQILISIACGLLAFDNVCLGVSPKWF